MMMSQVGVEDPGGVDSDLDPTLEKKKPAPDPIPGGITGSGSDTRKTTGSDPRKTIRIRTRPLKKHPDPTSQEFPAASIYNSMNNKCK